MTYATYETSLDRGTPIELYEFVQGQRKWHLVSAADPVTLSSLVYIPSPVERSRVNQTTDTFKDGLSLTFPRDDPFASQFLGFAPEEVTTVTLRRGHYGDPDNQFIVYWKGRVAGAKTSGNEVQVECESVFTSIRRPGLRARFEYGCRHSLYSRGCGAQLVLYKLTGVVQALTGGVTITVLGSAANGNGYYTGGMLLTPDGSSRFIISHTSDIVTLSRPIASLVGGMTVDLYPGCDHRRETCIAKFNNLNNFGGFPFIPAINPFDGSLV